MTSEVETRSGEYLKPRNVVRSPIEIINTIPPLRGVPEWWAAVGESGWWWGSILGKVYSSLSHFQNLTWGQIPQAAERKPCCKRAGPQVDRNVSLQMEKCSQLVG